MCGILLLLQTVHQTGYTLAKKTFHNLEFTLAELTQRYGMNYHKEEQNNAISKDWYIYYKFMDVTTGKLMRMSNVKGGSNRHKTKKERLQILTYLRNALEYLLEKGLNPYLEPDLSML